MYDIRIDFHLCHKLPFCKSVVVSFFFLQPDTYRTCVSQSFIILTPFVMYIQQLHTFLIFILQISAVLIHINIIQNQKISIRTCNKIKKNFFFLHFPISFLSNTSLSSIASVICISISSLLHITLLSDPYLFYSIYQSYFYISFFMSYLIIII